MKVQESDNKRYCDNCGEYTYVFDISTETDEYPQLTLCKKCLLKLLKAIIER